MTIYAKWAVNKTTAEVQMVDGYIKLAPNGGWKGITYREVDHVDVIDAQRKGWVELVDKEPTTPQNPPRAGVKIADSTQGTTQPPVKTMSTKAEEAADWAKKG